MLMMLAPVACIISIIGAPFHQFEDITLQPLFFFVCVYDGFWLAPGGIKLKMTTSGPNSWFWAQNHGFGPDVVTFGVNPSKTTKNNLIWPKPRFWAQEPGFGPDVVILGVWEGTQENMLPALPAPGRSPLNKLLCWAPRTKIYELLCKLPQKHSSRNCELLLWAVKALKSSYY